MNASQEAALVQRCQTGDTEAFRMLVEVHRKMLFGVAYLMTRDRGMAEDAVQESLIQIWQHLPSLRRPNSIKPWSVRIVVNEVKQQLRKKQVPTTPLETVPDIPSELDEPGKEMMQAEKRQFIRQALNKLPQAQKEAVILRYSSDLTVPEIAEILNQPEGTIKSRLSRALSRLNGLFQNDGVSGEGR